MTHVGKIENAQSQTIMKNEKKRSVISKTGANSCALEGNRILFSSQVAPRAGNG